MGCLMAEADFASRILNKLSPHFQIHHQVTGRHFSGKKLRLDAVVCPLESEEWKNRNVALGIEFKDTIRIAGDTTNYTKWLAQCVDYSHTKWSRFGYIFVFACPELIEGIPGRRHSGGAGWLLPRILGHLGIGELREVPNYGLTFFLHDSHRIWSEYQGVELGCHWSLRRKFGSR